MRWTMMLTVCVVFTSVAATAHADDPFDAKIKQQCPAFAVWLKGRPPHQTMEQRDAHEIFTEPALREELLRMVDEDQKTRDAEIASGGKDESINKAVYAADGRHLPPLKHIDKTQGFPTEVQVGAKGVDAAFLLTQHADRDPDFQAHVLEELRPRVSIGGISGQDFAMLTDRVLRAQNKPQRFGTQFDFKDGGMVMQKTEDPADLDKRRAAIGLFPMADYECMMRVEYQPMLKH